MWRRPGDRLDRSQAEHRLICRDSARPARQQEKNVGKRDQQDDKKDQPNRQAIFALRHSTPAIARVWAYCSTPAYPTQELAGLCNIPIRGIFYKWRMTND